MRILHISDTHQYFPESLPKADVLVHTGDYSFLSKKASLEKQIKELIELNDYFRDIKNSGIARKIIFTPGNHDFIFEKYPKVAKELLTMATVLIDNEYVYEGVKFYGTPSQPIFFNWAFNHPELIREKKYSDIPKDADVLLTHCPPYEILDLVSNKSYSAGENVGCPILRREVERIKPKLHCFGHIHDQILTIKEINGTIYSNACIMDDSYKPNGKYNIIKVEKE